MAIVAITREGQRIPQNNSVQVKNTVGTEYYQKEPVRVWCEAHACEAPEQVGVGEVKLKEAFVP